jgi:hypothetical protein
VRSRPIGWWAFALGLLCASPAMADAPLPPPAPVTRCSVDGGHCATADPTADTLTVYAMRGKVRGETAWTLKGWERDFYVQNGGQYLVVCFSGLNLLPLDYKPEWPMLTFYDGGRLVRRVLLRDLITDPSKLRRTASHYAWGRCRGFDVQGAFEVETVDRGVLKFDVRTGLPVKDKH